MNTETISMVIDELKNGWDALYPILLKQVYFNYIRNFGAIVLFLIILIVTLKFQFTLNRITKEYVLLKRNFKPTYEKNTEPEIAFREFLDNNEFYVTEKNDELSVADIILIISWIFLMFSSILIISLILYNINYIINPDYLVLKLMLNYIN